MSEERRYFVYIVCQRFKENLHRHDEQPSAKAPGAQVEADSRLYD